MAEKVAKSHTQSSNRARHTEPERKVAFKGVLDSALRIQWPSVLMNTQNVALACLISHLDGVAHFRSCVKREAKRKLPQSDQPDGVKRRRLGDSDHRDNHNTTQDMPEAPVVTQHIVVGINEVTKRLEQQIHDARKIITLSSAGAEPQKCEALPRLGVVFACRADVDPTMIIDHLPHLVAAFNSIRSSPMCLLVPLPKGAELALSEALGIRRAAVVGLSADFPNLSGILNQLEAVPKLTASWLSIDESTQLIPTHVKQLRTSAPKDMKSSKERRAKERAGAKAKARRESSQHVT